MLAVKTFKGEQHSWQYQTIIDQEVHEINIKFQPIPQPELKNELWYNQIAVTPKAEDNCSVSCLSKDSTG